MVSTKGYARRAKLVIAKISSLSELNLVVNYTSFIVQQNWLIKIIHKNQYWSFRCKDSFQIRKEN